MTVSMDERMETASVFFADRAAAARNQEKRQMLEHLRQMADAIQQNVRMLDVLRLELEELRRVSGMHP